MKSRKSPAGAWIHMAKAALPLAALSALTAVAACSASKKSNEGFGGDDSSTIIAASGSASLNGSTGSQTDSVGSLVGSVTGAGGGSGTTTCSADLHSILDSNGNVIMTCPPNQGCGKMGCEDACQAAIDNQSTLGCDFYSIPPGSEFETAGSCFAAFIANTWDAPLTITADYGGQQLDISNIAYVPQGSGMSLTYQPLSGGQLMPNELAIVFLSQGPSAGSYWIGCPKPAGISMDPALAATGMGTAFHLTTSAPVVAYDIYPYGGAQSHVTSATLLIPTSTWGTNYIGADAYPADPTLAMYGLYPHMQIVAAQDGTAVTISPTAPIVGGSGVQATGKGQPATYMLNKGQMLQFLQNDELAGSPIQSTKPISVWGGSSCMYIPQSVEACDSAHQQLLPISALGNEYVAVNYRDRVQGVTENPPWTVVGVTDGTNLTYDPAPPAGAPISINSGQVVMFNSSTPFSVKSQDAMHPFYVAGHMTGALAADPNQEYNAPGDPEYVNTVTPQQYLTNYLFLTDPTYPNTNLVFIRKQAPDKSFKDVTLDCLGTIPASSWQPIGSSGQYQYARVDLVVEESPQSQPGVGTPQGNCNNGLHTAKSDVPFGLTVWGWDNTTSYAYPVGESVKPINTVIVPPNPK